MKHSTKSRFIFISLFFIFIIPLIGAHYFFQHAHDLHLKTSNKGELILPAVPPEKLPFKPIINQWSLAYYADVCCDKECSMNLLVAQQLIKALGSDQARLGSVLIEPDHCQQSTDNHSTVFLIKSAQSTLQNNLHLIPGRLYIIDPHGNLIMSYKQHYNPLDVYTDLKQLLRVSSIG